MEQFANDSTQPRVAPHVDLAVIEAARRSGDPLIIKAIVFTGENAVLAVANEENT